MIVPIYVNVKIGASLSYKLVGTWKNPVNYRSLVSTGLLIATKIKFYGKEISTPNPAKSGNQIKIELIKSSIGEYVIDLYNLQRQLIKSSLAKIENEANSFTFQIPIITPDSYLLQMTNKKSGKKHNEKIIIQ